MWWWGKPTGSAPMALIWRWQILVSSEQLRAASPWMHWWAAARPASPSSRRRPRGRRRGSAGARAARPSWRTPASGRRGAGRGRPSAGPAPGDLLQSLTQERHSQLEYTFIWCAVVFTLNYLNVIQYHEAEKGIYFVNVKEMSTEERSSKTKVWINLIQEPTWDILSDRGAIMGQIPDKKDIILYYIINIYL